MADLQLALAEDLKIPAEAITETFAILGKRGKGKSTTAAVLVEELVTAGLPAVVLDSIGVWWGLRSSADGTKAGLPVVIFGGHHADVPLEESAGTVIADVLAEHRIPAVIDLSGFSKAGMRRFATDFLERLYRVNRLPLHLVFDEADEFAPQRSAPESRRLLGAMEDIVRRGRARGLGATLVTQRPAVLSKDVLSQAEVLIALGMTSVRDVAAIDEWVRLNADDDEAKTVKGSLASMNTGEAWVWSPSWLGILQRIHVRRRSTFDSSATPRVGTVRPIPKKMAEVDLAHLGQQIQATRERAEQDDPAALRRRVARLERDLSAARDTKPEERLVEIPTIDTTTLDRLDDLAAEARDALAAAQGRLDEIHAVIEAARATVRQPVRTSPPGRPALPPTRRATAVPAAREAASHEEGGALGKAERSVLSVLAVHARALTAVQVAMLTGYSHKSGGFRNALGKLRSAGLIIGGKDSITITETGIAQIGENVEPLPSGHALVEHWISRLGKAHRAILSELIAVWPEPLDQETLAERTGYSSTSGGFRNALGNLRTLELIHGGRDAIWANDELGEANRA